MPLLVTVVSEQGVRMSTKPRTHTCTCSKSHLPGRASKVRQSILPGCSCTHIHTTRSCITATSRITGCVHWQRLCSGAVQRARSETVKRITTPANNASRNTWLRNLRKPNSCRTLAHQQNRQMLQLHKHLCSHLLPRLPTLPLGPCCCSLPCPHDMLQQQRLRPVPEHIQRPSKP